jgi:hypothetical protein
MMGWCLRSGGHHQIGPFVWRYALDMAIAVLRLSAQCCSKCPELECGKESAAFGGALRPTTFQWLLGHRACGSSDPLAIEPTPLLSHYSISSSA